MDEKRKNILLNWIVWIGVACVVISYGEFGLFKNSNTKKQHSIEEVEVEKEPWEEENITLYSIKFGIDRKILYGVWKDYNNLTDSFSMYLDSDDESFEIIDPKEAIDQISQKYDQPQTKIAQIILHLKGFDLDNLCGDYCMDNCVDYCAEEREGHRPDYY